MLELQNFKNYFLNKTFQLYKYDPEKGFIPKKSFFKGSTLGYKINDQFISLKRLKTEPTKAAENYEMPF